MELAERRKVLGYSQEGLAQALGVDRTTVSRWESGRSVPQPALRPRLANLLGVHPAELDTFVARNGTDRPDEPPGPLPSISGSIDDMIRRDFLRALAVGGALAAVSDDAALLQEGAQRGAPEDFLRMNSHLWQVYQLARSKAALEPLVHGQLSALTASLKGAAPEAVQTLCDAAADLFQLAGELAFDGNRYADAAAAYTLAASASRDSRSFDLWACSLVRHAYVDLAEGRHQQAAEVLEAAALVADRGDTALSTRHWVASVQAETHAGLGDLAACERALDRAADVRDFTATPHNGGWLRLDGSRLTEERGACYLRLGRHDLAQTALTESLGQPALAPGQSYRRRGAVLTDLALVGAHRRDPDQVVAFGRQAVDCAAASSSGYLTRRLRSLHTACDALSGDGRITEFRAQIAALGAT